MTESYLFSFTYSLHLLYWLIVYGLAGYAVKHIAETAAQRRAHVPVHNRVKPKRRG